MLLNATAVWRITVLCAFPIWATLLLIFATFLAVVIFANVKMPYSEILNEIISLIGCHHINYSLLYLL